MANSGNSDKPTKRFASFDELVAAVKQQLKYHAKQHREKAADYDSEKRSRVGKK